MTGAAPSHRFEPFVEIALLQNESEMLNVPATSRLRVRNAKLEESARLLRIARTVCAVAALIGSGLGVIAIPGSPESAGDWLTLAGVAILILLAAFALLNRWDLLPAWGQTIARFAGEGIGGLPARFRELAERRSSA